MRLLRIRSFEFFTAAALRFSTGAGPVGYVMYRPYQRGGWGLRGRRARPYAAVLTLLAYLRGKREGVSELVWVATLEVGNIPQAMAVG